MEELLRRLGYERLARQERPLVGENFVFTPASHASAKDFVVVHEDVSVLETPVAVVRTLHLQHAAKRSSTLRLTLALCWNGFRDALTLLSRFPASFQRTIPVEAVLNATEKYQIGDAGLAWAWDGQGEPVILAFVRNNVFVSLHGHDAGTLPRALGKEIDEALAGLRTTDRYIEETPGVFAELKRREGEIPKVPSGARLEFGPLPGGEETFVFFATSGSVNRDPARRDGWYYRAGTEKGRQEVTLYRISSGILPKTERLTVEVI